MYCALGSMLPYQEVRPGQPSGRQKPVAAPIPWHGQAAGLVTDFHAGVRRLEVDLCGIVTGVRGVRRGGSDRNTQFAVSRIVNLAEAIDDQTAIGVLSFFDRWLRKAEAVFSPDKGLHRVPREPGEPELRCPCCIYQTMRWQPSSGIIVCVNPECRTEEGIRPRWRADYVLVGEEMRFTWEPLREESA